MFCPECGQASADNSNFCRHCGKKLTKGKELKGTENVPQTSAPAPAPAQAVSSTPVSDVKNAIKDGKKKDAIIAFVVTTVIVITSFVCINTFFSTVPKSLVEDNIRESSSFNKGFVSSNYTNDSNYVLSDVEITGSETVDNSLQLAWYGGKEGKTVYFKGKLKNDSFESEFSGNATFVRDSNGWRTAGSASKTSSTTKPLKGVINST